MIGFQSWKNMLLIFGATAVILLVSPSQMQLVFSSQQSQNASSLPSSQVPSTTLVPPVFKGEQSSNSGQSQGGSQDGAPNPSDGGDGASDSDSNQQQAINHINQAQSALQNGDTQGAQTHMDSAKKALICNPGDPAHC